MVDTNYSFDALQNTSNTADESDYVEGTINFASEPIDLPLQHSRSESNLLNVQPVHSYQKFISESVQNSFNATETKKSGKYDTNTIK